MSLILQVTPKTKKDADLKEMWKLGVTEEIWCTISWSILLMEIYAILCCSECQQDILIHMFVRAINRSLVIIMFSLSPFSFLMLLDDSAQRLIRDSIKIGQRKARGTLEHPSCISNYRVFGHFMELFKAFLFYQQILITLQHMKREFQFWDNRWVYLGLETSANCKVV